MRRRKFLRGLMAVVFWLAVWQFAAWRLSLSVQWSELLLPYPTSVARRLVELMTGGEFWLTALASLGRILAAFLAGAAAGALFAALCSVSGVCSALVSPLMLAVRATPVASFIILLRLWLPGPGEGLTGGKWPGWYSLRKIRSNELDGTADHAGALPAF